MKLFYSVTYRSNSIFIENRLDLIIFLKSSSLESLASMTFSTASSSTFCAILLIPFSKNQRTGAFACFDLDGRVYDPFKGVDDIKNGYIKFIGDPAKRIKEDYLRILRYLRFFLNSGQRSINERLNRLRSLSSRIRLMFSTA